MKRALLIIFKFTQITGHKHPNLQLSFNNYQSLLNKMKLPAAEISARLDKLGKEAGYNSADWSLLRASLTGRM